jgi:hypothetical protein
VCGAFDVAAVAACRHPLTILRCATRQEDAAYNDAIFEHVIVFEVRPDWRAFEDDGLSRHSMRTTRRRCNASTECSLDGFYRMKYLLAVPFLLCAGMVVAPPAPSARAQQPIIAPHCGWFGPQIRNGTAPPEEWIGAPHFKVSYGAKFCNRILVGGVLETIPSGTLVLQGGISADVTNTCIDKVCGQALAPNSWYKVYVFKQEGVLKLDFSTGDHVEDPTYGNEVHADDPARSLVGLVRTDATGLVWGGAHIGTLSWFNHYYHTGIGLQIQAGTPLPYTCSSTLTSSLGAKMPDDSVVSSYDWTIRFLTWGFNKWFRQGVDVPNIYLLGTLISDTVGASARAAIEVTANRTQPIVSVANSDPWQGSNIVGYTKGTANQVVGVAAASIGATGADEGPVDAKIMLSNANTTGCVRFHGRFITSPKTF